MNILEKIEFLENTLLNESGIRNMKDLSKEYKTAEIYFHKDTDGVTSAIGMKQYLKSYGIKVIDAHPLNYGGEEYNIPKPRNKTLAVLVDFAHGKPVMHIHTDHHEGQVGVAKGTSTSFVKTPSNAAYISQVLSPNDLFPAADVKVISTVDSADFASQNISPDDVMRATFKVDPKLDVSKNKRAMGLAVNTLLLAYKNKKGFLTDLVMKASPSLQSMFVIIRKLAKEAGYKTPEEVTSGKQDYVSKQAKNFVDGGIKVITKLKNGQYTRVGNMISQYGGGYMVKGYDRYTPFKNNEWADYLNIAWPMGLIQVSKNPFKRGSNPHHLGDLMLKKVMPKFKSKFNKEITLEYIKMVFERDIKEMGMLGFQFNDFIGLFEGKIKGLTGSDNWQNMVQDITNKPYKKLSKKQKDILKKVTINLYDLILAQSGGHKDITNVSGINFYGKGYVDIMKDMMVEIAKVMKDKTLEG
jgi:hypothetical protein